MRETDDATAVANVATTPVAEDRGEPAQADPAPSGAEVEAELLIEDVSIDGMCGVY